MITMILQLLQRGLQLYWPGNEQFVSVRSEVNSPNSWQFFLMRSSTLVAFELSRHGCHVCDNSANLNTVNNITFVLSRGE